MTAVLDEAKALASTDQSGFMNVLIAGTSVVYNGQHITYYVSTNLERKYYSDTSSCVQEKALASNILRLQLNVKQILADSA